MDQPRWQPVLQAVPGEPTSGGGSGRTTSTSGWLNALVLAGTGGGEGLAEGPRFLLARVGPVLLVGGACRAAMLSETMNSDGSRPFYCFVGWLSKDAGAAVPPLEAIEAQWLTWARAVYRAWMPLDWDRHPTDLGEAHEPPFGDGPWSAEALSTSRAGQAHHPVAKVHGGIAQIPLDARGAVWRIAFRTRRFRLRRRPRHVASGPAPDTHAYRHAGGCAECRSARR